LLVSNRVIAANKCFNLINPLSWFLREDNARTTPSLRSSSGTDLKVKPMLERRSRAGRIIAIY